MNFVVIGTDHRMQHAEAGFKGLLSALLDHRYFEPLVAIAEEYHEALGRSAAQQFATERRLRWYNLDMTAEENRNAGILEEQLNRPSRFQEKLTVRLPSDEIREEAWVCKANRL